MQKNLQLKEKKEEEFALLKSMDELLAKDDFAGLKKLIEENKIKCAVSGTSNWTDIRQFNLMFSTEFGLLYLQMKKIINLFAAGNCTGNFCKFFECAKNRKNENSFWYCTNR